MINWLHNDILWGCGQKRAFFFDRDFLGDRARLLQCLYQAYLEVLGDPLNKGGPTDCCA